MSEPLHHTVTPREPDAPAGQPPTGAPVVYRPDGVPEGHPDSPEALEAEQARLDDALAHAHDDDDDDDGLPNPEARQATEADKAGADDAGDDANDRPSV